MKTLPVLIFMAGLLGVAQPARAQAPSLDLHWSAGIGWQQPLDFLRYVAMPDRAADSELSIAELSGAPIFSLGLQLETASFVHVRSTLSYAWPARVEVQGLRGGRTAIASAALQVLVRPWEDRAVRPYLAGGGGLRHYRLSRSADIAELCPALCSSRLYPSLQAGAGLDWEVSGRRLFAEALLLLNQFDPELEEVVLEDGDVLSYQPGRVQRDLVLRMSVLLPL